MERSFRWAERSKRAHEGNDAALFGIVQGGVHRELRTRSAEVLKAIGFDGYAIGGLAVGEPEEERNAMLEHTCPQLPAAQPRYLMGVGRPEDPGERSEEHTSELQSLMRNSYAVCCLKKKKT